MDLRGYLTAQLEPICDADPEVLADYVLALLKHDKHDLKETCINQLEDFLKEETVPFVNKLFESPLILDHVGKQHANGEQQSIDAAKASTLPDAAATAANDGGRGDEANGTGAGDYSSSTAQHTEAQTRSSSSSRGARTDGHRFPADEGRFNKRRRSTEGTEDFDYRQKHMRPNNFGGQQGYQGRGGRGDYNNRDNRRGGGRGSYNNGNNNLGNFWPGADGFAGVGGMAHGARWDNGMSEWAVPMGGANGLMAMNGSNFRGRRGRGRGGQGFDHSGSRRMRCRDYDEQGYCLRGDQCPFDHGADRIVMDSALMARNPYEVVPIMGMPGSAFQAPALPLAVEAQASEAYDPDQASFAQTSSIEQQVGMNADATMEGVDSAWGGYDSGRGQRGFRNHGRGRGIRRGRGAPPGASFAPYIPRSKSDTIVVDNIPDENCKLDTVNAFFKKFGNIINIQMNPRQNKAMIQFETPEEAKAAHSSPDPVFSNRFVKVYFFQPGREAEMQSGGMNDYGHHGEQHHGHPPAPMVVAPAMQAVNANAAKPEGLKADKKADAQNQMRAMLELQKQKEQLIQKQIEYQKQILEKLEKKNLSSKDRALLLSTAKTAEETARTTLSSAVTASATVKAHVPSKLSQEEIERERLDRELDLLTKMNSNIQPDDGKEADPALKAQLEALKAEEFGELSSLQFDEENATATVQFKLRRDAEKAYGKGIHIDDKAARLAWIEDVPVSTGASGAAAATGEGAAGTEEAPSTGPDEEIEGDLDALYEDEDENERGWKHNRSVPDLKNVNEDWTGRRTFLYELQSRLMVMADALAPLATATFNFQRQIQYWIKGQESPQDPEAGVEDDRTEKLDVRGLLLSQPRNMEAELRFHKELFSKLKFNFLEQTTKEAFLKRILGESVVWCTDNDMSSAESRNEVLKRRLKSIKAETEVARESLAEMIQRVCEAHVAFLERREQLRSLETQLSDQIGKQEELKAAVNPESVRRPLPRNALNPALQQRTVDEIEAILSDLQAPLQNYLNEEALLKERFQELEADTQRVSAAIREMEAEKGRLGACIAEAESAVSRRDSRFDQYIKWCEDWSKKLMDLQGIEGVKVVSSSCVEITYVWLRRRDTLRLTFNETGSKHVVDAQFMSGTCTIDDIVEAANRPSPLDLPHLEHLSDVTTLLAHESLRRFRCQLMLENELTLLGSRSAEVGWSSAWDAQERVVTFASLDGARAMSVRVDYDYPSHPSCMEICRVWPEALGSVESMQDLVNEHLPQTLSDLLLFLN
ncbi:hypothetical protein HK101_003193 [Irineochytrium annulatum]|nr:hypothetical protein HK101_003193 [Irineochytrium annulatum]